jgi:hypothetical protein
MRGNIVVAAAVFALGIVVGAGVLVLGFRWALTDAADRLNVSIERHGQQTQRGAEQAGRPIQAAIGELATRVNSHASAVAEAGRVIGNPKVTMTDPVAVVDRVPIRIQGTRGDDRSLPVDVQIQGKEK